MNRMRVMLALALLGLLVVLVVTPSAGARPAQTKTKITVTLTDDRIVLSKFRGQSRLTQVVPQISQHPVGHTRLRRLETH